MRTRADCAQRRFAASDRPCASGQTFMGTLIVVGTDTIVPVHFISTTNSRQILPSSGVAEQSLKWGEASMSSTIHIHVFSFCMHSSARKIGYVLHKKCEL